MNGIGMSLEGRGVSIIEGTIITIKFITRGKQFDIQAQVVYSVKDKERPKTRNYGMEFLLIDKNEIRDIIDNYC